MHRQPVHLLPPRSLTTAASLSRPSSRATFTERSFIRRSPAIWVCKLSATSRQSAPPPLPNQLTEARAMLAKRVIACLDVKDGRVVKGINFLELRDAGDPA